MFNNKKVNKLERKIKALENLLKLEKYTDLPSIGGGSYFDSENNESWLIKLQYFNSKLITDSFGELLNHLKLNIERTPASDAGVKITKQKK